LFKLGEVLASPDNVPAISARRAFAAKNTWRHRVDDLEHVIAALPEPLISVIVVTYNNLELTRACLDSIERFSDYGNLEIIVVDNASSDGSPQFLQQWAAEGVNRRLVLNPDNRGFSAANNQGLKLAQGEYLVLLNNDTEVTPGWLQGLVKHLRADSSLGMVGPVTNNIGNEARIKLRYADSAEMREKSRSYTLRHMGETFPIRTLAFFCVMLRRSVYEKVGSLDEAFGLGFFEDDDYCRRVEQAGWRLACAEDVFIHHHLSASFNKMGKGREALMEKNRKIYEAKWGPWVPHQGR
jgi:GT2 family glycosyltransferase